MGQLGKAFADGGIFMYFILLSGLVGLGISALQIFKRRERNLVPLIIGAAVGTFLLGILGTVMGCIEGFTAMSMVAADQKPGLMAKMIAIALNTTAFGVMLGGLQTLLGSIAATVKKGRAAT
jgi:hypothetical protein